MEEREENPKRRQTRGSLKKTQPQRPERREGNFEGEGAELRTCDVRRMYCTRRPVCTSMGTVVDGVVEDGWDEGGETFGSKTFTGSTPGSSIDGKRRLNYYLRGRTNFYLTKLSSFGSVLLHASKSNFYSRVVTDHADQTATSRPAGMHENLGESTRESKRRKATCTL